MNMQIQVKPGYETWAKLLAGEKPQLVNDHPSAGFYRVRSGDSWAPVAYWMQDDGTLCCAFGIKDTDGKIARIDDTTAREKWSFACKHPITEEIYMMVTNGGAWPDVSETMIGHNRAPVADTLEAIKDRIDDLGRNAEELIKAGEAKDEATADQASDWANTFGELETKADTLREAEKKPHLDAGRAVDGKWRQIITRAADIKTRLKRVVCTPYQIKQEAKKAELLAAAVAKGMAPEAVPEVHTTVGSIKRQTALRTQVSAEVTDWDALLKHLHAHPDIREAAQRIANASAKAGIDLPGIKIIKTKVAA